MSDQRLARNLAEAQRGAFIGYGSGFLEVTWTPSVGGTTTDGSFTYIQQVGTGRLIGDVFFYMAQIQVDTMPTAPTGNLRVYGFPYVATSGNNWPAAIGYQNSVEITYAYVGGGSQAMFFADSSFLTTTAFAATAGLVIQVSGFYFVQ